MKQDSSSLEGETKRLESMFNDRRQSSLAGCNQIGCNQDSIAALFFSEGGNNEGQKSKT
jgi:hypothetical protein